MLNDTCVDNQTQRNLMLVVERKSGRYRIVNGQRMFVPSGQYVKPLQFKLNPGKNCGLTYLKGDLDLAIEDLSSAGAFPSQKFKVDVKRALSGDPTILTITENGKEFAMRVNPASNEPKARKPKKCYARDKKTHKLVEVPCKK